MDKAGDSGIIYSEICDYEKDTKDMIEVAVSSSGKLGLELKDYGSIIYVQDMEKECNEHGLAGVDCITERKGG
ncbi:hypothetical protein HAX54_028487 [Datura stramonium]|uniref:Uncharacterized protein n=1 Tax=Datura stramonium TaxID=4076 RepID=A0ABS8S9K3_DATST|nr:hypothetical protein [Datura stramonium]